MSVLQLQTSTELPYYEQRVELEGVGYVFRFRWNSRFEFWAIDLLDADESALINGIKVVIDTDMLSPYRHLAVPPGVLTAFDSAASKISPGLNELGDRVLLLYVESDASL